MIQYYKQIFSKSHFLSKVGTSCCIFCSKYNPKKLFNSYIGYGLAERFKHLADNGSNKAFLYWVEVKHIAFLYVNPPKTPELAKTAPTIQQSSSK